ncbi:uncharacterized protein LOC119736130 [Patiria miniata]|uniref:Uncharacterized protein n=1 Tax=Patiria miniata TaxID=46514 RepID=A0A914AQN2_PATMI|nr:uncharacterized protein LOC119736130 [Patiria miniata]
MGSSLSYRQFLCTGILDKISRDRTDLCLVIAPLWPTQAWFPQLLSMCVAQPIKLPQTALNQPQQIQPLNLRLAAWTISGNDGKQRDFRVTLPSSSQVPGDRAQKNITSLPGNVGLAGAVEGKLSHLRHLF